MESFEKPKFVPRKAQAERIIDIGDELAEGNSIAAGRKIDGKPVTKEQAEEAAAKLNESIKLFGGLNQAQIEQKKREEVLRKVAEFDQKKEDGGSSKQTG